MRPLSEILDIIATNALTVRCLPRITISLWQYREGDESRLKSTQTIVEKHGRKFIREVKTVLDGGMWLVEETNHTMSTVKFGKNSFKAYTLNEAIELYLNSKKCVH